MSAPREEILRRIRSALSDVPAREGAAVASIPRDYRRRDARPPEEVVDCFAQRVCEYRAEVRRVAATDVAGAVLQACTEMGLRQVVVPRALPAQWRPTGVEVLEDEALSAEDLDRIDGALTGCATAIAETGTLVLDGQGVSGRRLITLVPDHHICVVAAEQVVGLVPEAISHLGPAVIERRVPVTLVSGPSASSDIELTRVEGVHGPRHLQVIILDSDPVRSSV